jgi:hypothetical protein
MKDQPNPSRPADKPDRAGRRPYRKPQLTEYGSIAKLTQGTRTNQSDGPGGGFKRACL